MIIKGLGRREIKTKNDTRIGFYFISNIMIDNYFI